VTRLPLALAGLLACAAFAAPASAVEIQAIEDSTGAAMGAVAVNDQGVVAAEVNGPDAARWDDGTVTLLQAGGDNAIPRDINNLGEVAGYVDPLSSSFPDKAAVWAAGSNTPTLLPGLESDLGAEGRGINAGGTVVGLAYRRAGGGSYQLYQPVRWPGPENLMVVDQEWFATDINTGGSILLLYHYGSVAPRLWRNGVSTELSCLNAPGPASLNDEDVVVDAMRATPATPARWQTGTCTPLPLLPGHTSARATAINNDGVAVGSSRTADHTSERAVMWSPTDEITRLQDLLPADSPWTLQSAIDINNNGQILGSGRRDGVFRHFLMTTDSPPAVEVKISPVGAASAAQTFDLTLTLRNASDSEDLEQVKLDYPHGFGVANAFYPLGQRGDIRVVSGPQPAFPTTLAAGESSVHKVKMRAITPGKVGLKAAVSARGVDSDTEVDDTHYGQVEIAQKQPLEAERTAMVAAGIAQFLSNANRVMREQQGRYAREMFDMLKKKMSAKARKFYFGSKKELEVTELERAIGRWRSQSPDLAALMTPNRAKPLYKDGFAYMNEDQLARLQQLEETAFSKKTSAFMGDLKKGIWVEALYWWQITSEEGRGRLSTDWAQFRDLNKQDGDALISAVASAVDPNKCTVALAQADLEFKREFAKAVDGLLKWRDGRVDRLVKLAETDSEKFIKQLSEDSAELRFAAFKVMADQLVGDVQDRLQGKLFDGVKGAISWLTNASDIVTKKGAKNLAKTTLISERSATIGPSYMDELSDEARHYIDLRKMEDIGGMPVEDVEITKGMIAQTNARLKQLGYDVEVEALYRPANPYKVEGAFAKVETVGVKNVSVMDMRLGAPPSLLAETAIFKPRKPETLAGFENFPEVEKIQLRRRYNERLDEYTQFHGARKDITDKKMKQMVKAFDGVHTFDQIGQGRTIKMQLARREVEGATVLKYEYLEVGGTKLIDSKGKPRPIGTDFDGAALIDAKTRQPLKGQVLTAAEFELNRLGEKAAREKGYANPFHGFTASGADSSSAEYPFFAHYWLTHLKEADAIREAQRLAADYNRKRKPEQWTTAAKLLSKTGGLFDRHLLRVSASEASFGPSNVLFRTPIVAP